MPHNKNTSLLLDLKQSHFKAVEDELMLSKHGVTFHHVVDHDQLGRYILALHEQVDLDHETYNDNLNYRCDEIHALRSLFLASSKKSILFKEYYFEVIGLKSKINWIVGSGKKVFQVVETAYNQFFKTGMLSEFTERNFKRELRNIKLLVGFCAGVSIDAMKKYTDIINSKIAIGEEDFFKEFLDGHFGEVSDNVENILNSYEQGKGKYNKIYSILVRQNLRLKFKTELHREARESSNRRDAVVIDKIDFANAYFKSLHDEGKINERHVFLYVSSTRNSNFLYHRSHLSQELQTLVCETRHNILRTNAQIFLLLLCRASSNPEKFLDEIKRLVLSYNDQEDWDQNEIDVFLKDKTNYVREELESSSILANIESYKPDILATLELLKNHDNKSSILLDQNLGDILGRLLEQGQDKTAIIRQEAEAFENAGMWLKFRLELNQSIIHLSENSNLEFFIPSGIDNIRGTLQTLPILLLYEDENYQTIIFEIAKFVTENVYFKGSEYKDFLESIIQDYFGSEYPIYEEKLLQAFIFLLIPGPATIVNSTTAFEYANYFVKHELERIRSISDSLALDYLYFILWVGRRIGKGEKMLSFVSKYSDIIGEDPRFSHGVSLIFYSMYEDTDRKEIQLLGKAIENAQAALLKYDTISDNPLLKNVRNSLYNSIAYFNVEMFEHTNREGSPHWELLTRARRNIDNLKKTSGTPYYRYPEYLHTEAYLEYLEALKLRYEYNLMPSAELKQQKRDGMLKKLAAASNAITRGTGLLSTNGEGERLTKYSDLLTKILEFKESELAKNT